MSEQGGWEGFVHCTQTHTTEQVSQDTVYALKHPERKVVLLTVTCGSLEAEPKEPNAAFAGENGKKFPPGLIIKKNIYVINQNEGNNVLL